MLGRPSSPWRKSLLRLRALSRRGVESGVPCSPARKAASAATLSLSLLRESALRLATRLSPRAAGVFDAPPRGRALCLAPHADDEILGCGGALALHRAQGDEVRVVIAFDGRLGLAPDGDPALRRAEALRGGAHLGLYDYVFLEHPEGHAPSPAELERGAREIAREIARFSPGVVYLPWHGDGHVDHRSLAAAAELALADFALDAWCYEVWSPLAPERVLDLGAVWPSLCDALGEHKSQLERDDLAARFAAKARSRGAGCASGRGEAYARGRVA